MVKRANREFLLLWNRDAAAVVVENRLMRDELVVAAEYEALSGQESVKGTRVKVNMAAN